MLVQLDVSTELHLVGAQIHANILMVATISSVLGELPAAEVDDVEIVRDPKLLDGKRMLSRDDGLIQKLPIQLIEVLVVCH